MPIGTVISILRSFERYVNYMNEHGFDDVVETIKENYTTLLITMRGHCDETYELEVYNSYTTGELCIENPINHVSLFDVLDFEEYELTDEKLNYIKFGR